MRKLLHHEIPRRDPTTVAASPRHPIVVIAHDIRSVYNVGSILRTSDAAAIEHLYITGYTAPPTHRGVAKTALGSQDFVPWSYEPDPLELVKKLSGKGYAIAALEITDSPTRTDQVLPDHFPLCLLLGNELEGVPDALLEIADLALEIPQYGAKHSLNVSVAFGIAIFDLVRRFRSFTGTRLEQ